MTLDYCAKGFIHMTQMEYLVCYWRIWVGFFIVMMFIVIII